MDKSHNLTIFPRGHTGCFCVKSHRLSYTGVTHYQSCTSGVCRMVMCDVHLISTRDAIICILAGIRGIIWAVGWHASHFPHRVLSLWPCLPRHWLPAKGAEHPSSIDLPGNHNLAWKEITAWESAYYSCQKYFRNSEEKKIHSISGLERILIKMFYN